MKSSCIGKKNFLFFVYHLKVCLSKQTGLYISTYVPFIALSNNTWANALCASFRLKITATPSHKLLHYRASHLPCTVNLNAIYALHASLPFSQWFMYECVLALFSSSIPFSFLLLPSPLTVSSHPVTPFLSYFSPLFFLPHSNVCFTLILSPFPPLSSPPL